MRNRLPLSVCLALVLVAGRAEAQFRPAGDPAPGENYHVEFALTFWEPTPSIVISTGALSPLGPSGVDFVREFGIENQRFREFSGVLKGGKHKLRVSHVPVEYTASTVLQRPVTFGGQTFNVNADAFADVKWDLWSFGYEWDFVSKDRVFIGILTELKFNRVTADLQTRDVTGTQTSLTQVSAPIPALGFIGRVYPHKIVSVTVEYSGFKVPGFILDKVLDSDEHDAHFRNFDLYGTVSLSRFFGITGGYRSMSADYIVDDDAGDLQMKGPHFGGMVRF